MFNAKRQYIDKPFWKLFFILIVVAIIALFSAGSTLAYADDSMLGPILKQIIFIGLGVAAAWFVQFLPTWSIRLGGYGLLAFSILCILLILPSNSPFASNINEASRWFKLGALQFQPSELAKLSLIIVVADLLTRIKDEASERKYFFITLGLTGVTCFPIMLSNLSTAILLAGIIFLMWFLARINWRYYCTVAGICVALMIMGYFIVEFGYVRPDRDMSGPFKRAKLWVKRVDAKIQDNNTNAAVFRLTDENYQSSIAKVAVARGGKTPIGVLPGNSQERDFLPLAYADYIFAIIVEETGIVGAFLLILLYLAVLVRACYASTKFADSASMLMVMGLALMITCQALISMAVAVGLGPVTGQPLPMISKGGTSVTVTSLYFGIMMCVAREQNELQAKQQTVKQESFNDIPTITLDLDPNDNVNGANISNRQDNVNIIENNNISNT